MHNPLEAARDPGQITGMLAEELAGHLLEWLDELPSPVVLKTHVFDPERSLLRRFAADPARVRLALAEAWSLLERAGLIVETDPRDRGYQLSATGHDLVGTARLAEFLKARR